MKFGEYLENNILDKWKYFYIDYNKLKNILNNNSIQKSTEYFKQINKELDKLNAFIQLMKHYNNEDEDLSKFLVINYMALFKSIKKHDKITSKNKKLEFFYTIQKQKFYQYYLDLPRQCNQIKLIIFDKDGTLINHEVMFGFWIANLISKVANNFKNISINDLSNELGYNYQDNTFDSMSIVARGTNDDVRNCICRYLRKNSEFNLDEIKFKINELWEPIEITNNNLIECGDTNKLFNYLISKNIKIAICTSDDRLPTLKTLELLNLKNKVNYISCGDDEFSSKPSPEPIWNICSNLNIDPSNTIMVGDTISDIHAGINAKCGKVIGVLSGGYKSHDLNKADLIMENIDKINELFNKEENFIKI